MHDARTLGDLFEQGGPVMWPLLGLSVVAVAVIAERTLHYTRRGLRFEPFVEDVCGLVRKDDLEGARRVAARQRNPVARIAEAFVDAAGRPKERREELLRREGAVLLEGAEHHLTWLRLAVQLAPILGLLGTVQGLLLAFWQLEATTGPIRPSDVAAGIGSALTTTVFGLVIAIPGSACLTVFEEHVDRIARRMGYAVSHLEEALAARGEGR